MLYNLAFGWFICQQQKKNKWRVCVIWMTYKRVEKMQQNVVMLIDRQVQTTLYELSTFQLYDLFQDKTI